MKIQKDKTWKKMKLLVTVVLTVVFENLLAHQFLKVHSFYL